MAGRSLISFVAAVGALCAAPAYAGYVPEESPRLEFDPSLSAHEPVRTKFARHKR
jgi:hypothetical protein